MKRSVSNLIVKFVGVLGDIIWDGFLGYYSLVLIFYFMPWILTGIPSYPFNNLDIKLRIIANIALILSYAFFVIMMYNFRLLLKNLSRKHFFSIDNYRYLRVIGFALILSNFSSYISFIVLTGMEYFIRPDLSLGGNIVFNVYHTIFLLIGIIFLAFAEVFREAAHMHDDQQLTV